MKIFVRNYALLALSSGLGYLSFTAFPGAADVRAVRMLLSDFDASSVQRLRFGRGDAAATLERSATGWAVVERGAPVGSVISYRSTDGSARILYAVRNEWSQDMGTVDAM
ncbi:MAG: hypothetical protein AAFP86_22340, partial [Planctomycetota bacterium]